MTDIVVTGPDGSTFNFPQGTSADTITGAMAAHYGQRGAQTQTGNFFTDIPSEMFSAGKSALSDIGQAFNPYSATNTARAEAEKNAPFYDISGEISQLGTVAKGLLGIPGLVGAPVTGAGRSVIGHALAAATPQGYYGPDVTTPQQVYNESKNDADLAMMALAPRGVGGAGVLGGAPLATGAVERGVNALASRVANTPSPLSSRATNMITRDLGNEGLTLKKAGLLAQSFGPEGMLADVSPSMRLRTEQIAQSDNPGRSGVINALTARSGNAQDRINSAFDALAGVRPNVQKTLQGIMDVRSQQAAPLYAAAYDAGDRPIWSNELEHLSAAPEVQQAMRSAVNGWQRSQIANGYGAMKPGAMVDSGSGGILQFLHGKVPVFPNLQFWDYTKNALDDMVANEIKPDGTLTKRGRDLTILTKKLRNDLDNQVPEYAAAREAWADPTKTMDAFNEGRKIFSSTVHPDMLNADFAALSQGEKDAFKLGTRAAIDEAMGRVRNGALKGRQLLDSNFNERKIMTVLGPEDGQNLVNALNGEEAMANTANQVLGNSATSRRMDNPFRVQQKSVGETPAGITRSLLNLRVGDAGSRFLQHIGDNMERQKVVNLAEQLGPFLTARGNERDTLLQQAIEAALRRQAAVRRARPINGLLNAGIRGGLLAGVAPIGGYYQGQSQ